MNPRPGTLYALLYITLIYINRAASFSWTIRYFNQCISVLDAVLDSIKSHSDYVPSQYLDRGAWFKFKGLGLPVLQIDLQNIRQEEQRVALQARRGSEVRGSVM